MGSGLGIGNYMCISTAHITEKDARRLALSTSSALIVRENDSVDSSGDAVVGDLSLVGQYVGEYGVFVWTGDGYTVESLREYNLEREVKFSDSFWKCIEHARLLGCSYVLFDRDGPYVDGFDVHEW